MISLHLYNSNLYGVFIAIIIIMLVDENKPQLYILLIVLMAICSLLESGFFTTPLKTLPKAPEVCNNFTNV